jgi:hypothetical protein
MWLFTKSNVYAKRSLDQDDVQQAEIEDFLSKVSLKADKIHIHDTYWNDQTSKWMDIRSHN